MGQLKYGFLYLKEAATLSAGMSFGELALLTHKPWSATIISKGKSVLAALDAKDYRNILEHVEKKKLEDKVNKLDKFYLLS